jgi:hypothetical protein
VTVGCAFPTKEDEECGVAGVGRDDVGAGDGMFHGPTHAVVVMLWLCDVGIVTCMCMGNCCRWKKI